MEPEEDEPWFMKERDDDEVDWTSARFERSTKGKARPYSSQMLACKPGWMVPKLEGNDG